MTAGSVNITLQSKKGADLQSPLYRPPVVCTDKDCKSWFWVELSLSYLNILQCVLT